MITEREKEREMVLPPNSFCLILDATKGNINVYVGPSKTAISDSDRPVIFDEHTKKFKRVSLEEAVQNFATAPEGWYLVLKNPSKNDKQPNSASASSLGEDGLLVGRKVNLPGPRSFSLWPGQMVKTIQGHRLRSNQYLMVRVYDEDAARKNLGEAVVKTTEGATTDKLIEDKDLVVGKVTVIKGTDISFYIPPTGIEVLKIGGSYTQEAVTLERLEYCILLDEDGNKRYIKGPSVVFPKPTEKFIERYKSRKFGARELSEISGIHVKVTMDYEEKGKKYKTGDELFITGKETPIYYPRIEHAIIGYGDKKIHYATAIPSGEARYLLNRLTGEIDLVKGPKMLLPDPRTHVLIRRILSKEQVELWFPGNFEALKYNLNLKQVNQEVDSLDTAQSNKENYFTINNDFTSDEAIKKMSNAPDTVEKQHALNSKDIINRTNTLKKSSIQRSINYSKPRTIILNTKYEGAVSIDIWTGYACNIINKNGERKVITGPTTYLLNYDETLESLALSTSNPKSSDGYFKTVYLRVLNNKVSDTIEVETKDLCNVTVGLSYRVNFEGDKNKWFNVENYVGLLTKRMRSLLKNCVKQTGIEEFYSNSITIIRDAILGKTTEGERKGYIFEENGMRIVDVEVLKIDIEDEEISDLLTEAQTRTIEQTLKIADLNRQIELTEKKAEIEQGIISIQNKTTLSKLLTDQEQINEELKCDLAKLNRELSIKEQSTQKELELQEVLDKIHEHKLDRQKTDRTAIYLHELEKNKAAIHLLEAKVAAFKTKMESVSPRLVAALQNLGDKQLAQELSKNMAPLSILGGGSIAEVFQNLVKGTILEGVMDAKNIKDNNLEE